MVERRLFGPEAGLQDGKPVQAAKLTMEYVEEYVEYVETQEVQTKWAIPVPGGELR